MNGRFYDPKLGRMLSPDPVTQAPENGQNYNRYSYVENNPLKFTDPSGYRKVRCPEKHKCSPWLGGSRGFTPPSLTIWVNPPSSSVSNSSGENNFANLSLPQLQIDGDVLDDNFAITVNSIPVGAGVELSWDSSNTNFSIPTNYSIPLNLTSSSESTIKWAGTATSNSIGESLDSGSGSYGVDLVWGAPDSVTDSIQKSVVLALAVPIATALAPLPAATSATFGALFDFATDTPLTWSNTLTDATVGALLSPIGFAIKAGNGRGARIVDFVRTEAAGFGVGTLLK